jgi:signal peptide peptidase SppA
MFTEARFGCSYELLALAPGYARMPAEQAALRFARRDGGSRYGFDGQVAIVELVGEMYKARTNGLRARLNQLATDQSVREILLYIDSPGGDVCSVHDLYLAVARAARHKPVTAFAEDMCCSAAYWVASAASSIYLNETGLAGSIGIYKVAVDISRALEAAGISYVVVRSGSRKGLGVAGAKITGEALAELQHRVDSCHNIFVAAVAKGRRMSVDRVRDLADGRVFTGVQAKGAGLVDGIATFEDVLNEVTARADESRQVAERRRIAQLRGPAAADEARKLICERFDVKDVTETGYKGFAFIQGHFPELFAAIAELPAKPYDLSKAGF